MCSKFGRREAAQRLAPAEAVSAGQDGVGLVGPQAVPGQVGERGARPAHRQGERLRAVRPARNEDLRRHDAGQRRGAAAERGHTRSALPGGQVRPGQGNRLTLRVGDNQGVGPACCEHVGVHRRAGRQAAERALAGGLGGLLGHRDLASRGEQPGDGRLA